MPKCPQCGRENKEVEKICVYCGMPLVDLVSKTRTLEDADFDEELLPKWGSARYASKITLIVITDDDEQRLEIETKDLQELKIGRYDPKTKVAPPIDLAPYGGGDKGVSRLHGAIIRSDTALQLVDYSSANGTYLNGQRLVPNQPRILRDGDDIRLGYLVMRISFERE